MLVGEVEHTIGLSKKSIRYYEENGLLKPKRNKDNDYRIYDEEDINQLKKIKFLRELGVPIKELQELAKGNLSLNECLKDRIHKINIEIEKFKRVESMCQEISISNLDFKNIDIDQYLKKINVLNKEGFTMRDIKTKKKHKVLGAILSSVFFSLFFIGFLLLFSYIQFTEAEKIPWIIYFFLIGIFGIPVICIIINLVSRLKEINGGEEDEASKY